MQEAFLRYHRAVSEGTQVESPRAFLSTVTTRLSIDHGKSARARRETYVGEWLPEPLLTDPSAPDPARHAEDADSLSMAFLLVLERLSPVERAVFLLRDVFAYEFDEIAEIVGKSEPNCRQLAVARPPARRGRQAPVRGLSGRTAGAGRPVLRGSGRGGHGRPRGPAGR